MKVFNGLKKLLMPSYCIHKIKWHFYKRKFGMIGQKCSMGRGFCLSGCSNIKFGDNVLCGDNSSLLSGKQKNKFQMKINTIMNQIY